MKLEDIRAPVQEDFLAVDRTIRKRLRSEVALVDQVSSYIIGSGGKRLRPLLVLLAARAAGYQGSGDSRPESGGNDRPGNGDRHIEAAALIEFIHTATLLHDDVVDGSSKRRGRDTANEVWGNEASVLVGDFLYSRAFQMMSELGSLDIMRIMADATNTIAEGEVLQLMNAHDPQTTEQRYLEVIYRKTARLFEAGAEVAAVLAEAGPERREAFARYGRHLGTAFQLIDDVLDYRGSAQERGKNLGDDLAEGKPTLPLIHALRHGTSAQQTLIREAIEHGGLDRLAAITDAIETTGGLDYTLKLAKQESAAAIAALQDALRDLPDSAEARALKALALFSVERTH